MSGKTLLGSDSALTMAGLSRLRAHGRLGKSFAPRAFLGASFISRQSCLR